MGVDHAGHEGALGRLDGPVGAAAPGFGRDVLVGADPGDTIALHQQRDAVRRCGAGRVEQACARDQISLAHGLALPCSPAPSRVPIHRAPARRYGFGFASPPLYDWQ